MATTTVFTAFTNAGVPETGIAPLPTIDIYRVSDNTLVVSSDNMVEITPGAGDGGFYKYDFTAFDPAERYAFVIDAGAGATVDARFNFGAIEEDTDPLNTQYLGSVWLDATNGSAGTTVGEHGTPQNPVTTLADALTLATAIGVRSLVVIDGALTLTAPLTEFLVELRDGASLALGGFSVDNSEFRGGTLTGVMTGTVVVRDAVLDGVSGLLGEARNCGLNGTLTLAAGETLFDRCASAEPGAARPTLDFVGAGRTCNIRGYSGGLQIDTMVNADNLCGIDFIAGQLIVDATCALGTLVVSGIVTVTDNSTGTTVDITGVVSPLAVENAVWDTVLASHAVAGSTGEALDAADATADPAAVATAVWEKLIADHASVGGSFAEFFDFLRVFSKNKQVLTVVSPNQTTFDYFDDAGTAVLFSVTVNRPGLGDVETRDAAV